MPRFAATALGWTGGWAKPGGQWAGQAGGSVASESHQDLRSGTVAGCAQNYPNSSCPDGAPQSRTGLPTVEALGQPSFLRTSSAHHLVPTSYLNRGALQGLAPHPWAGRLFSAPCGAEGSSPFPHQPLPSLPPPPSAGHHPGHLRPFSSSHHPPPSAFLPPTHSPGPAPRISGLQGKPRPAPPWSTQH